MIDYAAKAYLLNGNKKLRQDHQWNDVVQLARTFFKHKFNSRNTWFSSGYITYVIQVTNRPITPSTPQTSHMIVCGRKLVLNTIKSVM